MALTYQPDEVIINDVRECLLRFRFGFENAVIVIGYFPIEDKRFIGANGIYRLQFELELDLRTSLSDRIKFYKKVGLIPVWADPIC